MSLMNEVETAERDRKTLWQRSRFLIVAVLVLAAFCGGVFIGAKNRNLAGTKNKYQADAPGQAGMRIRASDTQHKRSFFFTTENDEPPAELKEETSRIEAGTQEVDATFTPTTEAAAIGRIGIGWGDRYTYIEGLEPQGDGHVHPVFDVTDKRHVLIKISLEGLGARFKLGQEAAIGLFDESGNQIGYFGDFSEKHTISVKQVPKRQRPAR